MTLPCAARISIPFRCTYVLNFGCFWRPNDATTSPSLGQLSWPFKRATPSPADRGRSEAPVRPLLVHHPQPAADRALPLGDLLPETLERGVRVRDFTVLLPELGVHRGQVLAPKPDPVVRLLDLLQHRGFFALGFLRFLFLLLDLPFQFFQRLALFLDLV